jgi:3-mercaptopyruvate sulfurtransferase SseA
MASSIDFTVIYRFVDCRWELTDPDAGRRAYLVGHIPGAAFLDVDRDLADERPASTAVRGVVCGRSVARRHRR